jgi:hypothetical protein
MKTTALVGYRMVNSLKGLKGLKSSEIAQTTNYSMFAPIFANRGKEKGYDEKRVQALVKLIESGEYFYDMSVVMVDKSGVTIDGANRIEAHRRTKTPVLFRVLADAMYNGTVIETLKVVTTFNGFNPTWSAKEQFDTALQAGSVLAKRLSSLRADFVGDSVKVSENDITVNLMMTLVEKDKKKAHSRKRNFREYFNDEFLKYSLTNEFAEEFVFVCKVIEYFKDSAFDAARILEQLLFVMWDDNKFNRNKFYHNLLKKNFVITNMDSNQKGKLIRAKILELSGR